MTTKRSVVFCRPSPVDSFSVNKGLEIPFLRIAQTTVSNALGVFGKIRVQFAARKRSDSLDEIAASGITPAEELLDAFEGHWQGDIDKIYEEYSY